MKIRVVVGDLSQVKTDGVIVNLFEGTKKVVGATGLVDKALHGAIGKLIKQGEIKGKFNEITIVRTLGQLPSRIVAIVGLGKRTEFNIEKARNISGQVCRALQKLNCQSIGTIIHGVGLGGLNRESAAQAVVEGAVLGLYSYDRHITKPPEYKEVSELLVVEQIKKDIDKLEDICLKGKIVAEATNLARDMANEPANYMKPIDMVKAAASISRKNGLELTVLDRKQMGKMGMGALLGVAQGTAQPPKFIILKYRGNSRSGKTLGFIGKAITFDSGGISLKSSENMKDMKGDMSGGAAVLAAMSAIAQLRLRLNITVIVAATENLPGGHALKPGDVVKAMNGKTIEVVNTDAEGRLTLADALNYAVKHKLSPIIDVATLTGACQVALGDICSGIFTNNQEFVNKVIDAGNNAGECLWQMPMKEDYREQNKSDIADMKNAGSRHGGAITAAMFLSEFVGETPWAHIDIAGTFMSDKEKGCIVKGATGVMVRTLFNLAESQTI